MRTAPREGRGAGGNTPSEPGNQPWRQLRFAVGGWRCVTGPPVPGPPDPSRIATDPKDMRRGGRRERTGMQATRIEAALAALPQGQDAVEAARMGLLEWVMTLPEGVSARDEARGVLDRREGASGDRHGRAVGLFLQYLEDIARMPARMTGTRRGGRRRRLH